ncbi:MAG: PspC domain-containing protein [Actinomycetales bacterium]
MSDHRPPAALPGGARVDDLFARLRASGVVRPGGTRAAGVCTGIANRVGVDPLLLQVIFVITTIFGAPALIVYAAGWLILPDPAGRIELEVMLRSRRVTAAGGWALVTAAVGALLIALGGVSPSAFGVVTAGIVLVALLVWWWTRTPVGQPPGDPFAVTAEAPAAVPREFPRGADADSADARRTPGAPGGQPGGHAGEPAVGTGGRVCLSKTQPGPAASREALPPQPVREPVISPSDTPAVSTPTNSLPSPAGWPAGRVDAVGALPVSSSGVRSPVVGEIRRRPPPRWLVLLGWMVYFGIVATVAALGSADQVGWTLPPPALAVLASACGLIGVGLITVLVGLAGRRTGGLLPLAVVAGLTLAGCVVVLRTSGWAGTDGLDDLIRSVVDVDVNLNG